jgi:hypothetical protein
MILKKSALLVAAATLAVVTGTQTAFAQKCAPREVFEDYLKNRYEERQDAIGVTPNGHLMEVFVSEQGTWTLLMSLPNGTSCILAAGEGWQNQLVAANAPEA